MEAVAIKNGRDFQTLRIPKEFGIDDDKVYIKKVGNALYLIPFHKPWESIFKSVDAFTDDFMSEREQNENQNRESFDL